MTIGGTTRSTTLQDNFKIHAVMGQTIPTLEGTIYDPNANLLVPAEGSDVIVTRGDTGARVFGGLLSMVTGRSEGVSRYWDIQCQGYAILLDRSSVSLRMQSSGLSLSNRPAQVSIR